jgi:soluble cytochrome b562
MNRTKLMLTSARTAAAGVLAAGVLVFSMGVGVPSSGAAQYRSSDEAAFCKTLIGFSIKFRTDAAPTGSTLTDYHAWVKKVIPLYESLASEAPNAATKKFLNALVAILKDYGSATSLSKLGSYETKNEATYLKGTKQLAASIEGCAKYA